MRRRLLFLTRTTTTATTTTLSPVVVMEAAAENTTTTSPSAVEGRLPTLLLSHGGGPCFFMRGGMFKGMDADAPVTARYKQMARELPSRPRAILVLSAHYETHGKQLELVGDTDAVVPLFYDYYGFPPETYKLKWEARGCPWLAKEVADLIAPLASTTVNNERGFDHGVFVPLKLMFPDADIPTVQLSISSSLDPAYHFRLGQALAPLRHKGVLIVGSGQATHGHLDLQATDFPREHAFIDYVESVLSSNKSAKERAESFRDLHKTAPNFQICHPRTEHWIPLIAATAAAWSEDKAKGTTCGLARFWFRGMALFVWALD